MASNSEIESEDNELTENNGDNVVTMMDVLREQEDFEEDANAVLGASDDKNCTYPLGYIKRQAIYACMTCCADAKEDPSKRAGVCLACSLSCHENHELIELYTKRNFRCDCGNPKFGSHPCQFTPNKIDLNEENSYNQNFSGLYCTCHRPYPDPEATVEDEMIQCIICEDWLHASHLEATVPTAQYAEMICKECMQKNDFLHNYSDLTVNTENDFIDVMNTSDDKSVLCNGDNKNETIAISTITVEHNNVDAEIVQANENKNEADSIKISKEIDDEIVKKEEIKTTTERMESELPIDTDSKKPNNINISTDAKDSEMAQSEKNESPENEESGSVLDPIKLQDVITDISENKDDNEDNIDSHINVITAHIENKEVTMDTSTVKQNDENVSTDANDSEMVQGEVAESAKKDEIPKPLILQGDSTNDMENKDSNEENNDSHINTLKEIVGSSEEIGSDITSEKEEKNNGTTSSQNNDTSEINGNEIFQSENVVPETENNLKENLSLNKSNEQLHNESINDKIESKNGDQDEISHCKSTENTNKSSESIFEHNTPPSNEESEKTVEPSGEDSQSIVTSNGGTEYQAASLSEDKILEKSDLVQSAEELEKMEEDKLLAEPDENAQMEETTENKTSDEGKTSTEENNKPLQEENIDNKLLVDNTKDGEEPKCSELDSIDMGENKIETAIQNDEEMECKKNSKESSAEDNFNYATIIKDSTDSIETKMEVNNEETEHSSVEIPMETTSENHDIKRKLSIEDTADIEAKKRKIDSIQCTKPKESKIKYKGATFWPSHFRQKLCTCNECLSMYKDLSVLFLMDLEDTVTAYETLGKEKTNGKPASQYEKGLQALSSLDRIQQINVLTEYNKMRDKFLDFLKSFKDRRKIVTEEDVKAFFAGMKPKRRPDGVYFCR